MKKRRFPTLLFLLVAGAGQAAVTAGTEEPVVVEPAAEIAAPPADPAHLDHRIAQLEKRATTWDKILANLPKISGYAS